MRRRQRGVDRSPLLLCPPARARLAPVVYGHAATPPLMLASPLHRPPLAAPTAPPRARCRRWATPSSSWVSPPSPGASPRRTSCSTAAWPCWWVVGWRGWGEGAGGGQWQLAGRAGGWRQRPNGWPSWWLGRRGQAKLRTLARPLARCTCHAPGHTLLQRLHALVCPPPPALLSLAQGFFAALINEANTGLGPIGQVRDERIGRSARA